MRFSLIVSTLDRTVEFHRLLNSLQAQTYCDFETIVVDQNDDDRLQALLDQTTWRFSLRRIRSGKGAARGRNAGIAKARGDVIAFPDDDCWYPPTVLEQVANLLTAHADWDGLSGRPADWPRWSSRAGPITRFNAWKRAIEWTTFERRCVVETVGGFDETIGPGANTPWGAGEGTDYLVRALEHGFRFQYQPSITVNHEIQDVPPERSVERSRLYAMGQGHVLRLRRFPAWFAAYRTARPMFGGLLALLKGKWQDALNRWAAAEGICHGFAMKAPTGPDQRHSENTIEIAPLER